MAWCPKCKTEYRDGIKTCADCGAELVDKLEEEKTEYIASFNEENDATKFIDFLKYSKLEECELSFDIKEERFIVYTTASYIDEAKKLFEIFRKEEESKDSDSAKEEARAEDNTIDVNEEDSLIDETGNIPLSHIIPESTTTYVKKKDRYEDLCSTFWIFIVFGIGGLVFTVLNVTKVLTLLNNYFQYTILSLVSLFFIFVAVKSFIDSRRIYNEIGSEEESSDDITTWLKENMTKESLQQFDDETLAPEVIFLKKTEYMKHKLYEVFDIDNDLFADEVIEEYYTNYIEHKED